MQAVLDACLQPFVDPASRTFWMGGVAFVVVALLWARRRFGSVVLQPFLHASSGLDLQLLLGRQLVRALGFAPFAGGAFSIGVGVVTVLDRLHRPSLELNPLWSGALYTIVLFVLWDLSRYVVHRLLHRVPWLWVFHQVHHSAEVLTPLTFHRVHPVESLVQGIRGVVVTGLISGVFYWLFRGAAIEATLLGVHAIGFAFNIVVGNLRHSHVHLGFGSFERWLISPAQHQLHHTQAGDGDNFGTWLALWDRLGNTLQPSGKVPLTAFGTHNPNHGHDLVSACLGPFQALWRHSVH